MAPNVDTKSWTGNFNGNFGFKFFCLKGYSNTQNLSFGQPGSGIANLALARPALKQRNRNNPFLIRADSMLPVESADHRIAKYKKIYQYAAFFAKALTSDCINLEELARTFTFQSSQETILTSLSPNQNDANVLQQKPLACLQT